MLGNHKNVFGCIPFGVKPQKLSGLLNARRW